MDLRKLNLLINTLQFLKPKQVWNRLFYLIRNRFFPKKSYKIFTQKFIGLNWKTTDILYEDSYFHQNEFDFLNSRHSFPYKIDWNYGELGKLWTYNLNYFEFLNQATIEKDKALSLIWDYIDCEKELKDGLEPYPISLRGINWIKFLSRNRINESKINEVLFKHYQILLKNLEYHLLGNHLLENGFSLLFGAYYFRDEPLYKNARNILMDELSEQILNDGGHFELSPMYHQILLHRLLDCTNLLKQNLWKEDDLFDFLIRKAQDMLGWLETVTYENGNIPMVNDCAFGIAPTSKQLFQYANTLGIKNDANALKESGYRKFKKFNYELFFDIGEVGPSYQPGHGHSDTFNFELYINNNPIIVDTGTSTYEKNEKRQEERQTASHNTVKIEGKEQTEVWGGFRVARRARIIELDEVGDMVSASHNGYSKSIRVIHNRTFIAREKIIIQDKLLSKGRATIKAEAFLHFHPDIKKVQIFQNSIRFDGLNSRIVFEGEPIKIKLAEYKYAAGFNKTLNATKAIISFSTELTTTIHP